MLKMCFIAIITGIIGLMIKDKNHGLGILLSLSSIIFLGIVIIDKLVELTGYLKYLSDISGISEEYILLLVKMLGIAYMAELSRTILKECKEESLSSQIEILAKLLMVSLGFPIIKSLIYTITECLQ